MLCNVIHVLFFVQSEFDAHVVPGHVKVHTYYGGDRNKDLEDLLNYDVVLTTYNTLQSEFSVPSRHFQSMRRNPF